jgi:hypothetical protein
MGTKRAGGMCARFFITNDTAQRSRAVASNRWKQKWVVRCLALRQSLQRLLEKLIGIRERQALAFENRFGQPTLNFLVA